MCSQEAGEEMKEGKVAVVEGDGSEATDRENDILFFPVQGINVDGFQKDFPMSPKNGTYVYHKYSQSQVHGKKIVLNGKEIALFFYRDTFYAVDEKCPHLGGPLHLGDIEDMSSYSGSSGCPCVVCPWHKWSFALSSGKQVWPPGRENHVNVYPVRTTKSGDIRIGFSRINPIYFTSDCDFD